MHNADHLAVLIVPNVINQLLEVYNIRITGEQEHGGIPIEINVFEAFEHMTATVKYPPRFELRAVEKLSRSI